MSRPIKKRWTLFGAVIGIGTTLSLVVSPPACSPCRHGGKLGRAEEYVSADGHGYGAGGQEAGRGQGQVEQQPGRLTTTSGCGATRTGGVARTSAAPTARRTCSARRPRQHAPLQGAGNEHRRLDASRRRSRRPWSLRLPLRRRRRPEPGCPSGTGGCTGEWCVVAGAVVDRSAAGQSVGRQAGGPRS